jgi:hypothetical protein
MFNFQFGKKKPDTKQLIIVSIVLSTLIAALSQCTKISEDGLWDLLDEIQRKYFPESIVGKVLNQNSKVVERRVNRDVGRAIEEYERLTGDTGKVRMPLPLYSEINGVMRLCSPWIEGCTGTPLEVYKEKEINLNLTQENTNTIKFFKF